MKVKVELLKARLEKKKKDLEVEIESIEKKQKTEREDHDKRCKEQFKVFLKESIEYHKGMLVEFEKMKTADDYRSMKNIYRPSFDTTSYNTSNPAWAQKQRVEKLDQLLRQLDLCAEATITLREADNYLRYV